MRSLWMKWMVLVFVLSMVAACGGGGGDGGDHPAGGGADSVSFKINNGPSQVLTETVSSTAPLGSDPYVYATYDPGTDLTQIYVFADYGGGMSPATNFGITFKGHAATAYTIPVWTNNDYKVGYTSYVTTQYASKSGTIDVTRFDGSVGGHIQGTFNVTVCDNPSFGCTTAMPMTGSFYVTRNN